MNWILSFLLICSWSIDVAAHGGHMATFKYEIAPTAIDLEFKIESGVLEHFKLEEECENYQAATAMCLMQYIREHSFLMHNGTEVAFELQGSSQNEHYQIIHLTAKGNFTNSDQFIIGNECFLEYDSEFENRIIIQKGDFNKSYRLDHHHTELKIDTKP